MHAIATKTRTRSRVPVLLTCAAGEQPDSVKRCTAQGCVSNTDSHLNSDFTGFQQSILFLNSESVCIYVVMTLGNATINHGWIRRRHSALLPICPSGLSQYCLEKQKKHFPHRPSI